MGPLSKDPTMDKQLTPRSDPSRYDPARHGARRALFGLCIVGIGALALLDNLKLFDTPLLQTFWPLILVAWGAARMAWSRHIGSQIFGALLLLVGALMTAHKLGYGSFDLRQWWPALIILAGASIVLRGFFPRSRMGAGLGTGRRRFESSTIEHADEVDVDATFSGIKLQNDSRSFKGGRIAITFSGLELDLREAVIDGPEATIDISATFSGIELRVPREWQVVVQMSATMGDVEDKSTPPAAPSHRLVLRGETLFGGVEIKN
jgi:predicted membrane protein